MTTFSILSMPLIMGPLLLIILTKKNLLTTLLGLELLSLSLVLIIILINSMPSNTLLNIFVVLSLAGCEASIALACLVSMLNKYGHDSPTSLMSSSS